jgi:putative mRNA 3-end processing factor
MVDRLGPQLVIVYHPEAGNSRYFSMFLNNKGIESCTLDDLSPARQTTL